MRVKTNLTLCVVALLATTQVHATDRNPEYEDVLIPILADNQFIHGAFGTTWETSLWARNAGDQFAGVTQGPPSCSIGICEPQGIAAKSTVPVGNLVAPLTQIPARLLHLENGTAASVFFSLRVRETSTGLQDEFEVPIVRESEFYNRPIELLNVPVASTHRIHLRVYDPRAIVTTKIRVDVYPMQSETLLGSEVLSVGGGDLQLEPQAFPPFPGYAEITSLQVRFPAVANHERIRVVLTPETSLTEFWGMISVTDNVTQHVNLITPQ